MPGNDKRTTILYHFDTYPPLNEALGKYANSASTTSQSGSSISLPAVSAEDTIDAYGSNAIQYNTDIVNKKFGAGSCGLKPSGNDGTCIIIRSPVSRSCQNTSSGGAPQTVCTEQVTILQDILFSLPSTIDFWVKFDNVSSGIQTVFSAIKQIGYRTYTVKQDYTTFSAQSIPLITTLQDASYSSEKIYNLQYDTVNHKWKFPLFKTNNNFVFEVSDTFNANVFYHMALVIHSSTDQYGWKISLLRDGQLIGQVSPNFSFSAGQLAITDFIVGRDIYNKESNNQARLPTVNGLDYFSGNIDELRFSTTDRYPTDSYTVPTTAYSIGGAALTPKPSPTPVYNTPAILISNLLYTGGDRVNLSINNFAGIEQKSFTLKSSIPCQCFLNYFYTYSLPVRNSSQDIEIRKMAYTDTLMESFTLKGAGGADPLYYVIVDEKKGYVAINYGINGTYLYNLNGDLITYGWVSSNSAYLTTPSLGAIMQGENNLFGTYNNYSKTIFYKLDDNLKIIEQKTTDINPSTPVYGFFYDKKWYIQPWGKNTVTVYNTDSSGFPSDIVNTFNISGLFVAGILLGPMNPILKVQLSIPQKDVLEVQNIAFTSIDNSVGSDLEYGWSGPVGQPPGIVPISSNAKKINDSHIQIGTNVSSYLQLPATIQDYKNELNNFTDLSYKTNQSAPAGTGLKTTIGKIAKVSQTAWNASLLLPNVSSAITLEIGSEGPIIDIISVTYLLVVRIKDSLGQYDNTLGLQYAAPVDVVNYNIFLPYHRLITGISGEARFDIYEIVESKMGSSGDYYKRIGLNSTTTSAFSVAALPPREDMLALKQKEYRNDPTGKADIYLLPTNNYDESVVGNILLERIRYDTAVQTNIFSGVPCYPQSPVTTNKWIVQGFNTKIYLYDTSFTLTDTITTATRAGFHGFNDHYYTADNGFNKLTLYKYDYSGFGLGSKTLSGITGQYYVNDIWVDETNNIVYVLARSRILKFDLISGALILQATLTRNGRGIYFNGSILYVVTEDRYVQKLDSNFNLLAEINLTSQVGLNGLYDLYFQGGDWYFTQYATGVGGYSIVRLSDSGGMPDTFISSTSISEKLGAYFSFNSIATPAGTPCATPWSSSDYSIVDSSLAQITSDRTVAYKVQDVAGIIPEGAAYYALITNGGLTTFQYAINLVRIGLFDPPKAIQGLKAASFVNSSVVITDQLTWNQQSDATSFRIWRTTDGSKPAYGATPNPPVRIIVYDAPLSTVTKGGVTYYEFNDTTGLTNAQQYTYTVYPVNPVGVGPYAYASVVAGDITAPDIVRDIKITTSGDATNPDAVMTWTNPKDSDFKETKILRKQGLNNIASNITDGTVIYTGSAETYTDSGLQNGAAYTYTFFASDFVGNLSKASGTIDPVGDVTPPGPVQNLNSQQNNNTNNPNVTLTWENPTDTDLKTVLVMRRKAKNANVQPRTPDEAESQGFEVIGQIEYH